MSDTTKTRRKREREKQTISQMVAIFCKDTHKVRLRAEEAHCGKLLCLECAQLESYAVLRTEQCRKMDNKTLCENCDNLCYDPAMRQAIREAMRYAGPRMPLHHPFAALRHLLNKHFA